MNAITRSVLSVRSGCAVVVSRIGDFFDTLPRFVDGVDTSDLATIRGREQ